MPESKSDKSIADQIIEEQKRQQLEEQARKLKEQQDQRLEEAKQRIRERGAASKAKKTYVVQAGDTLGKIAQEVYGDGSRWKEIWEANKDIVPNADRIEVGQKLKIP
ncbi:MAG: LysM peptidoglycan-binding domain-containing protein [Anaerolineae bacterium]|nr:LysM peptidoglycan-binding domain-containing protein [Anaerolineae bacterium]